MNTVIVGLKAFQFNDDFSVIKVISGVTGDCIANYDGDLLLGEVLRNLQSSQKALAVVLDLSDQVLMQRGIRT